MTPTERTTSEHDSKELDADVIVVGYGPVGALLAGLLGRRGVRVLVLERDGDLYSLPRAGGIDGEVMRVLQTLGCADEIEPRLHVASGFEFVDSAGDRLMLWQRERRVLPNLWANGYSIVQPDVEGPLRHAVESMTNVSVRRGIEVTSVSDGPDYGSVTAITSSGRIDTYRARYIVGCEGGRSVVRRAIGVDQEDLGLHQPWLVVDLKLTADVALSDYVIHYCDPARPVTYVPKARDNRRWEFMLMPGESPNQLEQPEMVWRLMAPWVSEDQAEIFRAVVYTFHSLLARRWRSGRLLLAGDAAHQMPPFLGQGLCSGVRDAANLAWKLAAVLDGADDDLLETYQTEREPHVRRLIVHAMELGEIIQTTSLESAAERDRRLRVEPLHIQLNDAMRLGPGLGSHDGPDPSGYLAPQVPTDDGRRLDDIVGSGFAILAPAEMVEQVDSPTAEIWRAAGAYVGVPPAALRPWLAKLGVDAVIIRPDRYVLGVARTPEEFAAATELMRAVVPTAVPSAAR